MAKIFVEAYGCSASFADSEMISGLIVNGGHTLATDSTESDLNLIVTCSVKDTTANKQKLQENIENSPVIVTLLTPKIGYLKSAELFKESLKTGKTIRELVVSKKLMSNKEIDSLFR